MSKLLTATNIFAAQLILRESTPGVMYRFIANNDYPYATLALGVAEQNTVAGIVALNFMKETIAAQGLSIDDNKIEIILHDMAYEYITALSKQSSGNIRIVTREITHAEAWDFHRAIFKRSGYSEDAWTLNSVFKVIPEADREVYWQQVLASAGSTTAELELAAKTYAMMYQVRFMASDEKQQVAAGWLDRIESIENASSIVELGRTKLEQTIDTLFKGMSDFIFGKPTYVPVPAPTMLEVPPTPELPPIGVSVPPPPQPSQPVRRRRKGRRGRRPPTTAGGYGYGGSYSGEGVRLTLDP